MPPSSSSLLVPVHALPRSSHAKTNSFTNKAGIEMRPIDFGGVQGTYSLDPPMSARCCLVGRADVGATGVELTPSSSCSLRPRAVTRPGSMGRSARAARGAREGERGGARRGFAGRVCCRGCSLLDMPDARSCARACGRWRTLLTPH